MTPDPITPERVRDARLDNLIERTERVAEPCPDCEVGEPHMCPIAAATPERALRDRIAQVADAYLRSWQRSPGAATLDTDVAQMLRNLLVENHPAWSADADVRLRNPAPVTLRNDGPDPITASWHRPGRATGGHPMTDPITPERVTLLPAESIALTVALAQVRRGDSADPNVGAMCVLALARLAGKYDWTEEADD